MNVVSGKVVGCDLVADFVLPDLVFLVRIFRLALLRIQPRRRHDGYSGTRHGQSSTDYITSAKTFVGERATRFSSSTFAR